MSRYRKIINALLDENRQVHRSRQVIPWPTPGRQGWATGSPDDSQYN